MFFRVAQTFSTPPQNHTPLYIRLKRLYWKQFYYIWLTATYEIRSDSKWVVRWFMGDFDSFSFILQL